ncbi:multidrug effflux MFS transporter [Haloglycomyces albus]|uniref:multidrug effflux MFS transporter n=1 Tax=Haloglycomyces albus TaxID=526067 RepID=UPI00046D4969|nr:multidrug effflux MFS transporter [Haloglycomyces albus]
MTPPANSSTAEAPLSEQTHSKRYVLLLMVVLGILTAVGPLSTDMYLPAFPAIADGLDTTEAYIQLTLTANMVGLAIGQALIGPLSDRYGRRKPLIIGMTVFTLATALSALSTTAYMLIAARAMQGFAGAAGMVVARAVIRDHFTGDAMTRFISKMMFITMLAPMLGPIIGGQIVVVAPWQMIFVLLGLISIAATLLIWRFLPESLPERERREINLKSLGRDVVRLLRTPQFVFPVLTVCFTFATMFTYISSFSFVSQVEFGASEQTYSLIFAIGTIAVLSGNQTNVFLMRREIPAPTRMISGMSLAVLGVVSLFTLHASGQANLVNLTVVVVVMMYGNGLVFPNTGALAMSSQPPNTAGTASALMGCLQMASGGALPALVMFGTVNLQHMAWGMLILSALATIAVSLTVRTYKQPQALAA